MSFDEEAGDTTDLRFCNDVAIVYALVFANTDLARILLSKATPPEYVPSLLSTARSRVRFSLGPSASSLALFISS